MIGKICPRGKRVGGLIRYLYATRPAQQEGRRRHQPASRPTAPGPRAPRHDRTCALPAGVIAWIIWSSLAGRQDALFGEGIRCFSS